jgi:hypothetical protein
MDFHGGLESYNGAVEGLCMQVVIVIALHPFDEDLDPDQPQTYPDPQK